MPIAYEGSEPYIFVSYSHRDSDAVMTAIEALQKEGFRVWFDGGIEAGSEWPEYIASHLKNSACVLTFISNQFVDSHNCRRELNFAQDLRKPLLNVYLYDVELTDGMRMQLGLSQALKKFNFKTETDFNNALCTARLLKECNTKDIKSTPKKTENTSKVQTDPQGVFVPITKVKKVSAEETPAKTESPKTAPTQAPTQAPKTAAKKKFQESGHPFIKGLVNWTGVIMELSYGYFGVAFIDRLTQNYTSFWKLFLWMLVPHAAISLLIVLLYRTLGRPLTSDERRDISPFVFLCWLVSSVLAVIIGTFYCHLDINIVLKFLSVLGLNAIPAVFSVMMMLNCDY